jgi:peptidoglycan-associated lipoprotein
MAKTSVVLAALSIAALISGGCANKDIVKTDDSATGTVTTDTSKQPNLKTDGSDVAVQQRTTDSGTDIKPADPGSDKTAAGVAAFETIYFDYDKFDLRADARAMLSKNAEAMLKTRTALKVRIEGHCDERGSAEYNLALGERRAKSAQQYLLTLGVQPDRLSVVSYGKEKPAVQGSSEEAWAKNRRVEFVTDK